MVWNFGSNFGNLIVLVNLIYIQFAIYCILFSFYLFLECREDVVVVAVNAMTVIVQDQDALDGVQGGSLNRDI